MTMPLLFYRIIVTLPVNQHITSAEALEQTWLAKKVPTVSGEGLKYQQSEECYGLNIREGKSLFYSHTHARKHACTQHTHTQASDSTSLPYSCDLET